MLHGSPTIGTAVKVVQAEMDEEIISLLERMSKVLQDVVADKADIERKLQQDTEEMNEFKREKTDKKSILFPKFTV